MPSTAEWMFHPSYRKVRRDRLVDNLWETVGAAFRRIIRSHVISGDRREAQLAVGFNHSTKVRVVCIAEFDADKLSPNHIGVIVGPPEFIEAEEEKIKSLAERWAHDGDR